MSTPLSPTIEPSHPVAVSNSQTPPCSTIFSHAEHSFVVPFSRNIFDATGKHQHLSYGVASVKPLSEIIKSAQLATLEHLELAIYPAQHSGDYGVTADVLWTTNDIVPTTTEFFEYPGSTRATFSGTPASGPYVIPCDFARINRIVKSPVSFTNAPRINVNVWLNTSATKVNNTNILASFILRGSVRLSYPSGNKF